MVVFNPPYHTSFPCLNFGVHYTLGRTINFNYDELKYLTSISQTWNGAARNWATFGYGELYVSTNFRDQYGYPLTVIGGASRTVPVLNRVGLPDGSA